MPSCSRYRCLLLGRSIVAGTAVKAAEVALMRLSPGRAALPQPRLSRPCASASARPCPPPQSAAAEERRRLRRRCPFQCSLPARCGTAPQSALWRGGWRCFRVGFPRAPRHGIRVQLPLLRSRCRCRSSDRVKRDEHCSRTAAHGPRLSLSGTGLATDGRATDQREKRWWLFLRAPIAVRCPFSPSRAPLSRIRPGSVASEPFGPKGNRGVRFSSVQ
jgi:hypothetical protein